MAAPALVELCAGMAGLSLRLAGRQRLVKYRGGKWKLASDIIRLGCLERPSRFVWAEANPHARRFLKTFSDPVISSGAVEVMQAWIAEGPEAMVARWSAVKSSLDISTKNGMPEGYPSSDSEFCAAFFLWRQVEGHRRIPDVHLVGVALPQIKWPQRLKSRDWIVDRTLKAAINFAGMRAEIYDDAGAVEPFQDAVVYLDPPYRGTHGYGPLDLPRERVVEMALSWDRAGAQVIVSEGAPVEELVAKGWNSAQLATRKCFNPGDLAQEFVTMNRAPYGAETILEGW